jgi:hypothetical protein
VTNKYDNSPKEIDFENIYVANDSDTAAEINKKLDEGLHLVL